MKLLAPNGQPSNLTPEQYRLVRTPAFKKWFGDWENDPENASKVVDENGEPLVCYHGTDKKFNIFDLSKVGEGSHLLGKAFYLTENYNVSKFYANHVAKKRFIIGYKEDLLGIFPIYSKDAEIQAKKFEVIYSLFVNAKSIVFIEDIEIDKELYEILYQISGIEKIYGKIRAKNKINEIIKYGNENNNEIYNYRGIFLYVIDQLQIDKSSSKFDKVSNYLKKKYNAIKFSPSDEFEKSGKLYFNYIVFEPNQIKLADGTNTTFDSINPDIRYDNGGTTGDMKYYHTTDFNTLNKHNIIFSSDYEDFRGNSLYVTDDLNYSKGFGDNTYIVFLKKGFKNISNDDIEVVYEGFKDYLIDYENYADFNSINVILEAIHDTNLPKEIIRKNLVDLGFDGLIEKNKFYTQISIWNEKSIERIQKLADGTNTTFDSKNHDIRFKNGGILENENFKKWFGESPFKNFNGEPKIYYHETLKENLPLIEENGFDLSIVGSRGNDNLMPNGVFLKDNNKEIGVGGRGDKVQIPVYVNAVNNILYFSNRNDFYEYLKDNREFYNAYWKVEDYDKEMSKLFDKEIWNKEVPFERGTPEWDNYFKEYERKSQEFLDDWSKELKILSEKSRMIVTDILKKRGVDAIVINNDEGSFGRRVYTLVVLNPYHIKSVNNIGTFDSNKKGIKYNDGGLIAPNGKPSNLPPELYKLVRTNAFKKWFGDWENAPETASKMVDENGEPLICFHGTKDKFYEFDYRTIGSANDRGYYGKGFYFTFQRDGKDRKFAYGEAGYYGDIILPVFLRIINPFDLEQLEMYKGVKISYRGVETLVFLCNIAKKFPSISNEIFFAKRKFIGNTNEIEKEWLPISILPDLVEGYRKKLKTYKYERKKGEYRIDGYVKSSIVHYDYTDKGGKKGSYEDFESLARQGYDINLKPEEIEIFLIRDALEKYDGIEMDLYPEGYMTRYPIITEEIQKNHDGILQGYYGDEAVVFKNTQIKLADNTNTTFDSQNSDIRYKFGGNVNSKELKMKELNKETYKTWKELVNMSSSELEKFMDSEEGREAGLSKKQADKLGIHYGRESAKWILKMKETNVEDWTSNMWDWAKRQISFISRMRGNKGKLYDENGKKTRKHTSLLIWGHNPEKYNMGGNVLFDTKTTLSIEEIENKLGRELHFWNDDIVNIGGLRYKKEFLKPYYTLIQ